MFNKKKKTTLITEKDVEQVIPTITMEDGVVYQLSPIIGDIIQGYNGKLHVISAKEVFMNLIDEYKFIETSKNNYVRTDKIRSVSLQIEEFILKKEFED